MFIKGLYILKEGKANINMTQVTIENIVASAKISEVLDVEFLADKIPEVSYNPDEFNGLTLKFEKPKTAVLILFNGKLVCTGAKDMDEVKTVVKKTVKKIKDAGFEVKKNYKVEIDNIVASVDLKKKLQLGSISKGLLLKHVVYEPEEFPGLIYKLDDSDAVLLLFSSGKIVCTGVKKVEDASNVINMMKEKLTSLGVL